MGKKNRTPNALRVETAGRKSVPCGCPPISWPGWTAAGGRDHLSVGRIYLLDNPLLDRRSSAAVGPACSGTGNAELNFIYVHLSGSSAGTTSTRSA
jgi:hypothetical protein